MFQSIISTKNKTNSQQTSHLSSYASYLLVESVLTLSLLSDPALAVALDALRPRRPFTFCESGTISESNNTKKNRQTHAAKTKQKPTRN
jgi:hypothetical protein